MKPLTSFRWTCPVESATEGDAVNPEKRVTPSLSYTVKSIMPFSPYNAKDATEITWGTV